MTFHRLIFTISLTFFLLGKYANAQCTMKIDIPDIGGATSQPSSSRSSSKSSKGSKSKKRGRLNLDNFASGCDEADEISVLLPDTWSTYKMTNKYGKSPKSSKSGKSHTEKTKYIYGDSENGSSINLLRKPSGQIVGSITDLNEGTVIQIAIDDDGGNIVDITSSEDFPPELEASDNFTIKDEAYPYEKPPYSLQNSTLRRRANTETFIIDVMVVWTARAECVHAEKNVGCSVTSSTQEKMEDLIDLAVHETNIAYEKSGVNIELELVHSYRSDYDEPSNNAFSQSLSDLRGKNDGKIDEVHTLREKYGADIVVMIIDDEAYCGVAYVGPAVDRMFSVVNWSCATGYYSFAHEIGHNMGLSHDRGATNKCSVLDAYNFGYRDPSAAFRSIMAYNCRVGQCDNIQRNGCSRIQRFSTPDQTFGGKPLGTTKENAARWLNEVASEISDYYEKKPLCSSENDCVDHAGDPCYVTTCDGVCTYTDICSIPSDGVCGRDKVWLQVDVQLDNYPAETSWTLKDECSDEIVVSMTGNNGDNKLGTEEFNFRTYSQQKTFICVDRKQYIFTINDTYGDGICCSYGIGYYSIEYEGMTGSAITGGSFQDTQSHAIDIGSCTVSTTSRPSAAPTLKPSKPPTMNPTQTPTKSPVSSPPTAINLESNFCVDDSTFIFKLDDGSTQNCSWLQRNVIEIEKYCNRGHIKGACRASCNFCLCTDDSSYKFRLTNNGKRRRCNWLVKNSRNIQVRRENYCFASDLQSASSDVGNACIESCGFCKG